MTKEQILKELDIRDYIDDYSLLNILDKKRKRWHPDKTTDPESSQEFNENFTKYGAYYDFIKSQIKLNAENSLPLAPVDASTLTLELITLKDENEDLQNGLQLLRAEKENLEREIETTKESKKKDASLNKEKTIADLIDRFKPKKKDLFHLGLSLSILATYNVLLKIEDTANIFTKYVTFFSSNTVNGLIVLILLIFLVVILIKIKSKSKIAAWTKLVLTTKFQRKLTDYLNTPHNFNYKYKFNHSENILSESDVHQCIHDEFAVKYGLIKPINSIKKMIIKFTGINEDVVFDDLKNIVIYDLLSKDLIEFYKNDDFQRLFRRK